MATQSEEITPLELTIECQKILSCVARLEQRGEKFGSEYIAKILHGSRDRKIIAAGHDTLSTYGIGRDNSINFWSNLANFLRQSDDVRVISIYKNDRRYSVLELNNRSREILKGERTVLVTSLHWQTILIDNQKGSNRVDTNTLVRKISKTLDNFSEVSIASKDAKISELYEALNSKDYELLELRHELETAYNQIEKERSDNLEQSKKDKKIEFDMQIKEIAKRTSNFNTEICEFIDRNQLDQKFSIDLAKELTKWLRFKLDHCLDENQEEKLYDLIKLAQDKGLITDQGAKYAHTIRVQRNLIAHEDIDVTTLEAQNYLCLFSASLLLNDFSIRKELLYKQEDTSQVTHPPRIPIEKLSPKIKKN